MNDAHLHIAINHFPIIGIIFGLGILVAGLLFKNLTLKNTAYVLFIITAITAFASMATGEGAEKMVEQMPDVTKKIIHIHEEVAEKLAFLLYGLALLSLIGLFLNRKNSSAAKYTAFMILILAAVGVWLSFESGTTGGEIRHTEIRSDSANAVDEHNPQHVE